MRNVVVLLALLIASSSCSYKIMRSGYQVKESDYKSCDIEIVKNINAPDSAVKVGEIKIGDSGFTLNCSENEAIDILKKEGCAINANIIRITEENRPDLLSSCYRCRAEFYRDSRIVSLKQGRENYDQVAVNKRVSDDSASNVIIFIVSFAVGYLIASALF